MMSVRRSSTLALAGLLAVGAMSITGCSQAKDAATSAASNAFSTQINEAIGGDSALKTQICDAFKSNADTAYEQAVKLINAKKAGAGDILSKAVSADQMKTWLNDNCK